MRRGEESRRREGKLHLRLREKEESVSVGDEKGKRRGKEKKRRREGAGKRGEVSPWEKKNEGVEKDARKGRVLAQVLKKGR